MPFAAPSTTDFATQRRAKIVATLGPASNTETVFRNLVRAGVDVVRLNFSHGTHEEKLALIQMIRKISREESKPLCILGDLQGPKIRTSTLKDHQPVLLEGRPAAHHHAARCPGHRGAGGHHLQNPGGERRARLAHSALRRPYRAARPGSLGGRRDLRDGQRRHAGRAQGHQPARHSGARALADGKGRRRPGIRAPERRGRHRRLLCAHRRRHPPGAQSGRRAYGSETWIIAKLEKPQAIEHLDDILAVADGIMVARGDLGVEVPPEHVPAIQKHIIRRATEFRKPVITATQMLESMIDNPAPHPRRGLRRGQRRL